MTKITLSKSTFTLIPEGTHIFKVMSVDDEKYEEFGKLSVKLQTAKGETHVEKFSLKKNDNEINEVALKVWSYFVRTCLNNFQVEEIDPQDIVGCYIKATVKHETYTRTKGEKAGEEATTVRLSDYTTASGFGSQAKAEAPTEAESDADDLDDFLND